MIFMEVAWMVGWTGDWGILLQVEEDCTAGESQCGGWRGSEATDAKEDKSLFG